MHAQTCKSGTHFETWFRPFIWYIKVNLKSAHLLKVGFCVQIVNTIVLDNVELNWRNLTIGTQCIKFTNDYYVQY